MVAFLDDPGFVKDQQAVECPDGRQAMRDYQGRPSLHQALHATRQASAHHFIMSLPKGYETMVGERMGFQGCNGWI